MDILSRILSVRDVSWVCYAYMWFYDLRKAKHWISLCSLVQRPNWDQRVNHPELRQTTLLVRWVWIYLCFEIDQWLEVLWCSMEHNFQCFSKHLAAAVEMSSIQYEVFSNHGVPPTRVPHTGSSTVEDSGFEHGCHYKSKGQCPCIPFFFFYR